MPAAATTLCVGALLLHIRAQCRSFPLRLSTRDIYAIVSLGHVNNQTSILTILAVCLDLPSSPKPRSCMVLGGSRACCVECLFKKKLFLSAPRLPPGCRHISNPAPTSVAAMKVKLDRSGNLLWRRRRRGRTWAGGSASSVGSGSGARAASDSLRTGERTNRTACGTGAYRLRLTCDAFDTFARASTGILCRDICYTGEDDLKHCGCRDRRGRASPCWVLSFLLTAAAAILLGFVTVEIGTKLSNPEQFWPGVRGRGFWAISTPGYYLLALATAASALAVLLLFLWALSICGNNSEQHVATHGKSATNERSMLLAMTEQAAAPPSRH
jgi:hypothetical protein